jgi:predicted TIM-barrel fold metal-dependent hydrolase
VTAVSGIVAVDRVAADSESDSASPDRPKVIDARVRMPSDRRFASIEAEEFYSDYDAALGVGPAWRKDTVALRAELDAANVDHAIVHAEYEVGDLADELNESVSAFVSTDRDRYSGFGTVSLRPLRIIRAVRQVDRVAALGLIGINIQPAFFDLAVDDRSLYPIYARAAEAGLAIAIHTGIHYARRHPATERPERLDQVASDIPEATIIACHGAWPWVAEMVAVAMRHPNILIDFGGLAPKYVGMPGSGWEVMRHFMDRGLRHQVLFATDWPVFPHQRAIDEWRAAGLREASLRALLGENAERRLLARRQVIR